MEGRGKTECLPPKRAFCRSLPLPIRQPRRFVLKALTVRNFVLVDRLDIEFGPGLTVITGESGAGKSILLDALSLVLGARVQRSKIRPGTTGCDVSAEFNVSEQPQALAVLGEQEAFDTESEGNCLVRRAASAEGRSRAFVNGAAVTAAVLARLAEPLIDIHGQDQHRLVMRPDQQRRLLDDFGADATLVAAVADAHRQRTQAVAELEAARANAQRRQERRALLAYQTEELGALGDDLGRFDEIAATHRRLSRAQEIVAAIGAAVTDIHNDLGSRASHIVRAIEDARDPHENLARAGELMNSVQVFLEEAGDELRRYLDSFDAADETLADVDARLSALHDVARRHRAPPARLAEHLAALNEELKELADQDTRVEALEAGARDAATEFGQLAEQLSGQRRAAAAPFAARVTEAIRELGLSEASLEVRFSPAESAAGLESVDYIVATNPKYPAGRLGDIASGGEISRISLAIQLVAAEHSALPCMILDEADVGVGGTSADVLGRVLRRLSRRAQVIAITHAPQIAALADAHMKVVRNDDQDVAIVPLDEDGRVGELARMLGGRTVTEESRSYAATLLREGRGASE